MKPTASNANIVFTSRAGLFASFVACVAVALGTLLFCVALVPAPALALSEGRVYEMVSPPYKGGYGASRIMAMAPSGESVAFESLGAFAGSPASTGQATYLARREATGWSTIPLDPPASIAPAQTVVDFSASLESVLVHAEVGPNSGAAALSADAPVQFLSQRVGLPDVPADWEVAGITLQAPPGAVEHGGSFAVDYQGGSRDLSNIIFYSVDALLPEAEHTRSNLYDLVAAGPDAPSLSLVDVNDDHEAIDPYCQPVLGAASGESSKANAISADGSAIFFTTNIDLAERENCDVTTPGYVSPGNPARLFVRLGGQSTLLISAPLASECVKTAPCHSAAPARAEFVGADEQGTRVFFTTAQPLVSEDTNTANDLYMAKLECPGGGEACAAAQREVSSLVLVSGALNAGKAAEVQGAMRVAPDGSRVYFVAQGVLSGANAEGAAPVKGADNLYVYDSISGGAPAFVADLCSGPGLSGVSRDSRCPSNLTETSGTGLNQSNDSSLWLSPESKAQTSGDGSFLLFSSYGQLVPGDTDTSKDIYRYDAMTGSLERVSVGEDGYDANGNDSRFDATIPYQKLQEAGNVYKQEDMETRAISEDGSRVVFTTAAPLSPDAVNGLENVYEWHQEPGEPGEGRVSLISTGASNEAASKTVISPSGRDVFFITSQGLVPQDTDGADDIYDARLGGGFPVVPAPVEPCSGDACQGPLTTPAPLLVPGSVVQAPGENLPEPAPAAAVSKSTKTKQVAKCRKGYVKKKGECVKAKAKKARAKKSDRRGNR